MCMCVWGGVEVLCDGLGTKCIFGTSWILETSNEYYMHMSGCRESSVSRRHTPAELYFGRKYEKV